MIIDTTTERLEILLSNAVSSSQATFLSSYNEIGAATIVPYQTGGTTNNTTAVTIMGSPPSGYQRQLKEFILTNNDTSPITLTVRFNDSSVTRNLFYGILQVNDDLIFNLENGWNIYDSYGQKRYEGTHVLRNNSIKIPDYTIYPTALTVTTLTSGSIAAISMGKADKPYSSITVTYRVTTAGTSITWGEMAIYRVGQPMGIGTQQEHMRLGVVSTATVWNSLGIKTTTIPISGCSKGDDLYVIMGVVGAGTLPAFRSSNVADSVSSMLRIVNTGGASTWRPSLTEQFVANGFSNAISGIIIVCQGN